MRIAFVGKGGSGKTTLSALFVRHLVETGRRVVAVDADINQHLGPALGLGDEFGATPTLGGDLRWLKDHLRGTNPRIASAEEMIKTTPPGRGSRVLPLDLDDELHTRYGHRFGTATLLRTGEFDTDDIGVACYHSKTGAVELYLNHLVDGPGEYVVVDMTAGADAFASGLFTRFDLVVLVAEPTIRGVGVYRQFRDHGSGHHLPLRVVGNKVADDEDVEWLRGQVGAALLTTVGRSRWVRSAERGAAAEFADCEPEVRSALRRIQDELDATSRDWERYHRDTVEFHLRNVDSWAGREHSGLRDQVDPGFVPGPAGLPDIVGAGPR